MKSSIRIILFFLYVAVIKVEAQVSAHNDSVLVTDQIDYMRHCLRKSHKEFNVGRIVMATSVIPGIFAYNQYVHSTNKSGGTASIACFALLLIGHFIQVDAHKWQYMAGLGITGDGEGVKVIYKFK